MIKVIGTGKGAIKDGEEKYIHENLVDKLINKGSVVLPENYKKGEEVKEVKPKKVKKDEKDS